MSDPSLFQWDRTAGRGVVPSLVSGWAALRGRTWRHRAMARVAICAIAALAVGCGAGRSIRGPGLPPTADSEGTSRQGSGHTRQQHYAYAHQVLPMLFFKRPAEFYEAIQQDGERFLLATWNQVGDDVADPTPVDSRQLNLQKREGDGREIFIVTFPTPQGVPEAYFAAMVYVKGVPSHYMTLERGVDPFTGQATTVLGEWTSDHRHENFGDGPTPTVDEFVRAVGELVAGNSDLQ